MRWKEQRKITMTRYHITQLHFNNSYGIIERKPHIFLLPFRSSFTERDKHTNNKRENKANWNKTKQTEKNVKCFPFSLLHVYIDFIVIDKNSHFLRFRKLKREAEGKYCNRSTFYNRRKSFFLCLSAEKLWHCLCAIISSGEISRE